MGSDAKKVLMINGIAAGKVITIVWRDGKMVITIARALKAVGQGNKALLKRTALGLVPVYNTLPAITTSATSVQCFQRQLQAEAKLRASSGKSDWKRFFSPRG